LAFEALRQTIAMNPPLQKLPPSAAPSVPDALIGWTSAAALVFFGFLFLDDAVIMGRTILVLGILMAANEVLKLHAALAGSKRGYHKLHLAVAVAFVTLVFFGFFSPATR